MSENDRPLISSPLTNFSPAVLDGYEKASGKDDSLRIIIPRVLYSTYCIRNKRGVGHLGSLAANKMDAVLVISSCKWILAEIVRLESGLRAEETARLVDQITERHPDGMWESNGERRIVAKLSKIEDKILFALFNRSPETVDELFRICEVTTRNHFERKLEGMHRAVLLTLKEGICTLSPKGSARAEQLILKINA